MTNESDCVCGESTSLCLGLTKGWDFAGNLPTDLRIVRLEFFILTAATPLDTTVYVTNGLSLRIATIQKHQNPNET